MIRGFCSLVLLLAGVLSAAHASADQSGLLCPERDLSLLHETAVPEERFNSDSAAQAMEFLADYLERARNKPADVTEPQRIEVRNATMMIRGYALRVDQLQNPTEFGRADFCKFLDEEAYRWH